MMKEDAVRDWFGALRDAADAGLKKIDEGRRDSSDTNSGRKDSVRTVKTRILLLQYLCGRLEKTLADAEGLDAESAEKIKGQLYSELMEDAVAGIWSDEENVEIAMFLYKCTNGLIKEKGFVSALEEALGSSVPEETGRAAAETADQVFMSFAERKKAPKAPDEKSRNSDDPPPGLDEFEYIDWIMTH